MPYGIGENMEKFVLFMENTGFSLVAVIFTAVLGYLIIGNLLKMLKLALLASSLDNALVNFVLTLVRFALLLALLLLCLAGLGIPLTGIVGAISAATLAVGIAVKDILSSVANGIVLVINCPFKEGDFVEIGSVSGTIKEVKLMHTVLTTPDNRQVMLPNSQVFTTSITNYSINDTRRIDLPVDVDYAEDPEKVKGILLEVASKHPMVLTDPAPACHYNYAKDSSISFNVRIWCRRTDYWTVTWDLNEQLTRTLMENGIQIPFPQVTVSYRQDKEVTE